MQGTFTENFEKHGFTIVHLTDLHVVSEPGEFQPTKPWFKIIIGRYKLHRPNYAASRQLLQKAVTLINQQIKPDLVIISGDLVNSASDTKAYELVKEELSRLHSPVSVVLGDHDTTHWEWPAKADPLFSSEVRSIAVDDFLVIGLPPFLSEDDIDRFIQLLEHSTMKRVIINHHRMLKASWLMNVLSKIYCPTLISSEADRLMEIIAQHPNIEYVFTGHSHTNYCFQKNRCRFITTASLAEYPFEIRVIQIPPGPRENKGMGRVFSIFSHRSDIF